MKSIRLASILVAVLAATPSWATDGFVGAWRGAYECNGVERRMHLEVTRLEGEAIFGTFTFITSSGAGSFAFHGLITAEGQQFHAVPVKSYDMPEGFGPVRFTGRLDGDMLFGMIAERVCGAFYAVRQPAS